MRNLSRKSSFGGSTTIMSIGAVLMGLSASVFAIDMPAYFNARNELQTSVDAAALAGAAQLPEGEAYAEDAAYELANANPVAGIELGEDNLSYKSTQSKFTVTGSVEVPTLMGKFLCALSGKQAGRDQEGGEQEGSDSGSNDSGTSGGGSSCSTMKVVASSSAAPAARDTILVIDTSSSMSSLGNNRPLTDVQKAAVNYINTIAKLQNDSVDRIGLVKFDEKSVLLNTLTSQADSLKYATVLNKVNTLKLYSGPSWNTNYQAGLKAALDELQANGRPNADKRIIFMTDGMPNQPAPTSYYSYSSTYPYNKCIDMVNNSSGVKALCVKKNGKTVCPVLPNPQITPSLIPSAATQCAKTYVDNIKTLTNAQTDRAKSMDVTIDTIIIHDPNYQDNATSIMRMMLKDPSWNPVNIAYYMNDTTGGQSFYALAYNANDISSIYAQIAQDIHIKLTN